MEQTRIMHDMRKLKAIAILLVVLGHACNPYTGFWVFVASERSQFYSTLTQYIGLFHMPLFVLISGTVYRYCRKEKNYYSTMGELASSKFKRVLLPYIFVGLFYMIPVWMFVKLRQKHKLEEFVLNYLGGQDSGHLWFLVMLFTLFILYFMLEKILEKNNVLTNLFILFLIQIVCAKFTTLFELRRAMVYLIYFYVGTVLYDKRKELYSLLNNKLVLIFGFIISVGTLYFLFNYRGSIGLLNKTSYARRLVEIVMSFAGISMTYIFLYAVTPVLRKIKIIKYVVNVLDKYNFEIYLLHEPLIFLVLFKLVKTSINPTLLVLLSTLTGVIGSVILFKLYTIVKSLFKKKVKNKEGHTAVA